MRIWRSFRFNVVGHWVEVECPARIDLAGGWSDTPPICYEMGGSVVNVAILVNGRVRCIKLLTNRTTNAPLFLVQKPIGARARRLNRPELVLVSEGQSEPLVITSLDDLMSYTNPTAPGALLKATLVCAGVVRNDIHQDFAQQLQEVRLIPWCFLFRVNTLDGFRHWEGAWNCKAGHSFLKDPGSEHLASWHPHSWPLSTLARAFRSTALS